MVFSKWKKRVEKNNVINAFAVKQCKAALVIVKP